MREGNTAFSPTTLRSICRRALENPRDQEVAERVIRLCHQFTKVSNGYRFIDNIRIEHHNKSMLGDEGTGGFTIVWRLPLDGAVDATTGPIIESNVPDAIEEIVYRLHVDSPASASAGVQHDTRSALISTLEDDNDTPYMYLEMHIIFFSEAESASRRVIDTLYTSTYVDTDARPEELVTAVNVSGPKMMSTSLTNPAEKEKPARSRNRHSERIDMRNSVKQRWRKRVRPDERDDGNEISESDTRNDRPKKRFREEKEASSVEDDKDDTNAPSNGILDWFRSML